MSLITFRYTAIGADGQNVRGEVAAETADAAYRELAAKGLRYVQIALPDETVAAPPAEAAGLQRPTKSKRLSAEESLLLAEHLESLAKSGLPLAAGLRAAADELQHPRLAAMFVAMADSLDQGHSLADVLQAHPQVVSPPIARLIESGVRSGRLADVLSQLLDIERTSRDLWRRVRLALAYPLFLLVALLGLLCFVGGFILPDFAKIYEGFSLKLPAATVTLLCFSGHRLFLLLGIAIAAFPLLLLFSRAVLTPAARNRLIAKIPFVGPALLWRQVMHWTRLLGLYIEQQIPLPEALRMAADGISDKDVARQSCVLARSAANGQAISDAVVRHTRLPRSLVPLLRAGEQSGALPDALRTIGDMFENRVRLRLQLIEVAFPPILFVIIGFGAVAVLNALIAPLIDLIYHLSK